MSTTQTFPTTQEVVNKVLEGIQHLPGTQELSLDQLDDFIYEVISSWDDQFEGNEEWFSEDEEDYKDTLRDNILSVLVSQ